MKAQIKRVSYVEPAHTHDSWHSILVTKGRMCVAGKDLRPGDYVFGCESRAGLSPLWRRADLR